MEERLKRDSVTDVVAAINKLAAGTRIQITYPPENSENTQNRRWASAFVKQRLCARLLVNGELKFIEELQQDLGAKVQKQKSWSWHQLWNPDWPRSCKCERWGSDVSPFRFCANRFLWRPWRCIVHVEGRKPLTFSDRFELDGMTFTEPSVNFFAFNNPYGACTHAKVSEKF